MAAPAQKQKRSISTSYLWVAILVIGAVLWVMRLDGPPPAPSGQSQPQETRAVVVSGSDLGDDWPLTVGSGTLKCDNGAVTFSTSATTYALNGTAKDLGGYSDITAIWAENSSVAGLKKDISPLIDRGLKLCN